MMEALPSNIPTPRTSITRKSLFPSDSIDSDSDLGHMSPLNSESSQSDQDELSSPLLKTKLSDYVIYNKNTIAGSNMQITAKSTPKNLRVPSTADTVSPLILSPMESLMSSPILYSPNSDSIVPVRSLRKSPSEKLKTPHDTSTSCAKIPKLIRKSLMDSSLKEVDQPEILSDSSPLNKSTKLDSSLNKSKVRTALFPESDDSIDISLSVKSFYPKNNTYERTNCDAKVLPKKVKQKSTAMYLCNRRKNRNGQINAGVRHKIKKPKQKKPSKELILKAALTVLDKSPLNDYFNKENLPKQNNVNAGVIEPAKAVGKMREFLQDFNKRKITPLNDCIEQEKFEMVVDKGRKRDHSPDNSNKKFFKSARQKGIITVNKNIKIEVDNGKFHLLETAAHNAKRRKVDLSFDDTLEESQENINLDAIITTLDSSDDNKLTTAKQPMTLSAIEKANILLSPTSQMCDMASELALSSPKRNAKMNINAILDTITMSSNPIILGKRKTNVFNNGSSTVDMSNGDKLFPIFQNGTTAGRVSKLHHAKRKETKSNSAKKFKSVSPNQMYLDAGQKRFGLTQCGECQMIYHLSDPGEELRHENYHNATNILRFHGWRNEHVVSKTVDSRIIRVTIHDSKIWWKKINDLMGVIDRDLGFYDMELNMNNAMVFLCIRNRTIVGCTVAEAKTTAYRMLSTETDAVMCSEESYPIRCGVQRVWVAPQHRRQGIATAMLDCVRANFVYGHVLRSEEMAFSSPTVAGKQLARAYCHTTNYHVYMY